MMYGQNSASLSPHLTLVISSILVVREKSLTLLQALRAAARMVGSGTRSIATRSALPFLISQPSMSFLSKYAMYLASNSASLSTRAPDLTPLLVTALMLLPATLLRARNIVYLL